MDGFDSFPPRGIFGRSFSDSAVTKQQDGKTRPNKLKTDSESTWICCQFSEKAEWNVHQSTAHSVLLFGEVSKGGLAFLWPEESKETGGFVVLSSIMRKFVSIPWV